MGLGKTHDLGNFVNQSGKTWYLNLNHRNPSTETVEKNFSDLEVRHNTNQSSEDDEVPVADSCYLYSSWFVSAQYFGVDLSSD